jgi:threonine synthase
MIGNPVSMPRVISLSERLKQLSGRELTVVRVSEQEIMDSMLVANRHGHVVCTQGGESLAGFLAAVEEGLVERDKGAVLDSTAHMLKFIDFQTMYYEDSFPARFEIEPKPELVNAPVLIKPENTPCPGPGNPLSGTELEAFLEATVKLAAQKLELE